MRSNWTPRILISLLTLFVGSPMYSQKLEVEGDVDVKNNQILNVADPSNPQDAATKAYVDAMSEILLNAGINGVVQDFDGNVYKTIKIGSQVWMAENLKTTHYSDGTPIPKVTDNTAWENLTTPGYCWYNNDSTLNAELLGALYNYYTVTDTNTRNVCPTGWDVPTDAEWTVLSDFLMNNGYGFQGINDIGKSLAAMYMWNSSTTSGDVGNDLGSNNSSSFSGLPGGVRFPDGSFGNFRTEGNWWGSTDSRYRVLFNFTDILGRDDIDERRGYSVRCLRN